MKVKRLSGVNTFTNNKIVEYELPKTPKTKYIVDDSSFIPMSEAVKQLSRVSVSNEIENMCYDFKDGKDTGMKVPIQRMGMSDITEISQSIMEDIHDITDKIEKGKKKAEKQAVLDAKLQSIKNISVSNTNQTSEN